jgi:hypothetical protein
MGYTQLFVKTGMLNQGGRFSYQKMPAEVCPVVDRKRAVNEIALVNTQNGEVTYGIKSLFKVIGYSMPVFKTLFNFAPFLWLMEKLYAFISYNRKVIIPAAIKTPGLQPDFKLTYRIAYLLFTWLVTAYILTHYAALLTDFVPLGGAYREYLICGGQIAFQGLIIFFYRKEKFWDYLGNMMTISCAGALLLFIGLSIAQLISLPGICYLIYFMMIAGLMLLEHLRRSKLLQLGLFLSITWVVYRLMVLGLILFF